MSVRKECPEVWVSGDSGRVVLERRNGDLLIPQIEGGRCIALLLSQSHARDIYDAIGDALGLNPLPTGEPVKERADGK